MQSKTESGNVRTNSTIYLHGPDAHTKQSTQTYTHIFQMIILSKCEQTKRKQKREIKRAHTKPINNDNGKPNRDPLRTHTHSTRTKSKREKEERKLPTNCLQHALLCLCIGIGIVAYSRNPIRIRMIYTHDTLPWLTKCVWMENHLKLQAHINLWKYVYTHIFCCCCCCYCLLNGIPKGRQKMKLFHRNAFICYLLSHTFDALLGCPWS